MQVPALIASVAQLQRRKRKEKKEGRWEVLLVNVALGARGEICRDVSNSNTKDSMSLTDSLPVKRQSTTIYVFAMNVWLFTRVNASIPLFCAFLDDVVGSR
jgi:hypothetical protein